MVNTIFNSEAEVTEYYNKDQENNKVVIFEGVVYDVKEYMPRHPCARRRRAGMCR